MFELLFVLLRNDHCRLEDIDHSCSEERRCGKSGMIGKLQAPGVKGMQMYLARAEADFTQLVMAKLADQQYVMNYISQ